MATVLKYPNWPIVSPAPLVAVAPSDKQTELLTVLQWQLQCEKLVPRCFCTILDTEGHQMGIKYSMVGFIKYLKINAVGNSKRGFYRSHCKRCRPPLAAECFRGLCLPELRVECSRPPLDPESRHAEASAPRARLIRRVSSGLLSLREFSRPPLTGARGLYALKWRLFTSWCGDRQLDPVNCPICTALEFVQTCFSAGFTHSTLKVYVAALPAHRTLLGGHSVVRHPQVTRFLHSARKLYALKWGSPAWPSQLPDWSSSGVRAGLSLHGVYSLHPEGLRGGFTGPPRRSRWPFSR